MEQISVQITYGSVQAVGTILKLNPTGLLIELEKITFPLGVRLQLSFSLPDIGHYTIEARSIKAYDNHKKRVRVETDKGPVIEERPYKLSEMHFVKPTEEMKAGIIQYLKALQAGLYSKR